MEVSLGAQILDARKNKGLSQRQLAAYIGKSQGEVSKYERDMVKPSNAIFIHIMNICADEKVFPSTPSVPDLIEMLRKSTMDRPEHSMARSLIAGIILNEKRISPLFASSRHKAIVPARDIGKCPG